MTVSNSTKRFFVMLVLSLAVTFAAQSRKSVVLADCPYPYDSCGDFAPFCDMWCGMQGVGICEFLCIEPIDEGSCATSFCDCCWWAN
jgi:hypothetical protein